jgi:hypothetical protein
MIELRDSATGLHSAAEWKEGKPGLFAVIIGVSKYPHLDGGETPARETYGFGQLATSAQTAYKIFEWLREGYNYGEIPLARCWLLLAPTDAEAALAASVNQTNLGEIAALPSMDNCTAAIQAWRDDMRTLGAEASSKSRALFFFSGHGIQASDRALLLPMDWLGKSASTPNHAISTQNVVNGLADVAVPQQWFFCDACRSSTPLLNQLGRLDGTDVLVEKQGESFERSYPVVYASARGMQAFEPPDAAQGCTFFGGALVDGLSAKDRSVVNFQHEPWRIEFDRLLSFVRAETHKRLIAAKVMPAGVVLGGQYLLDNPTITIVSGPGNFPPESNTRRDPPSGWSKAAAAFARDASISAIEQALVSDLKTFADHPYGSERFTSFIENGSVAWFARGPVTGSSGITRAKLWIERVIRSAEGDQLEVTFSVPAPAYDAWLEFEDSPAAGGDGSTFGISIPRGVPRFVLVAEGDARRKITELSVYPKARGDDDEGSSGDLHALYRFYRTLNPVQATHRLERDIRPLYIGLLEKANNPVAALEAALILLRSGRFGLLYGDTSATPDPKHVDDWLANLAQSFDPGSDASVLVAQRLVSDPHGSRGNAERAINIVSGIEARGFPHTAEGVAYLLNLVRRARRGVVAERLQGIAAELLKLEGAVEASCLAEVAVETNGLFAVYGAGGEGGSRAAFDAVKTSYLETMSSRQD